MATVAILQPDVRAEARLSGALGGSHEVLTLSSWDDVERTLATGAVDACIVDVEHPDRGTATRKIASLRSRFPDIAIIVSVESGPAEGYFGLGGLGVDGVVAVSARPSRLRSDVDTALTIARAQRVTRELRRRLPAPGPEAVAWAVEHAGPDTTVERLAAGLGHNAASLRDTLQQANLPSPARILLWGRLLLASARLGDDGRRVEDVAFSLGYSTSTSFSRAMKLHSGRTPAEVSFRGAMSVVLEALIEDSGTPPSGGQSKRSSVMARLVSLVAAVTLSACATVGRGVDNSAIEDVLNSSPIDQLHVGVLAIDADNGRVLYEHNSRRKFIPASNQKILVTATALSLLGPDYRFRTEVWATGATEGSSLDGDLVIVATGDPSLSGRYWPSGTEALEAIADSLHRRGIRRVTGSLLIDVSSWDSTTVGPTWEVEDLRYTSGSTGGAFAIDEGEIEIIVKAGPAVGSPAHVVWSPIGTDDFVHSRVRTSPPGGPTRVRPGYLPESRRLVLDGVAEWGTEDTLSFALRDPVRQAAAALSNAIGRAGIEVEGGWAVRWAEGERIGRGCRSGWLAKCEGAALLAVMQSPPLSELIAGILEPSQNWMTEQLIRALGSRYGTEGSWSEGVGVVEAYLVNEMGVSPLDVAPRDGSGLSAYNLVTPRALTLILRLMRSGPHAEEFRNALAEPGEEDSTLGGRLAELDGRVFAKTGTISNVNSLSGYLVREDGQEVIFSVLTNGSGLPAAQVRLAIDDIVRALAR